VLVKGYIMSCVPKIKQYSVCMIKRKSGVSSGYLNLPQEFLRELQRRGVKSLLVMYDSILGAFPDTVGILPETCRAPEAVRTEQ